MSKIAKEKIDPHAVIVDTNILFDQDKSNVVHPNFDAFWSKHAQAANLELVLPHVVIGEILFQQTTSALKTLSRANESFDRLSTYTGKTYSHRVNESRLRKEIKDRFYSWAISKKFEELATPINEILWDDVINASIWRLPPFSSDTKKEDQEKGFRDAMILEAVVSYCKNNLSKKVVFITNDRLLREASEERLIEDQTFSAFDSLDDLEAYLRLEKESLEQSFIKSVVKKAAKKFFKYKDKSSLVYKDDLISLIKEKFGSKFENPQSLIPADFEEGFYSDGDWKAVRRGHYEIQGKPQFQKIENENTFIWLSKVRFYRTYECCSDWEDEIYSFVHEIFFDVYWQSNISVNERFTKMKIFEIRHTDSKFTPAND